MNEVEEEAHFTFTTDGSRENNLLGHVLKHRDITTQYDTIYVGVGEKWER